MSDKHDVGYGKPPKQAQFKKGTSGNPHGRPKGTKNLKTLIKRELEGSITVEQNGQKRKLRRKELLVKGLVNDALKGRDRPRETILGMVERTEMTEESRIETDAELSEHDAQILARFLTRKSRSSPPNDGN